MLKAFKKRNKKHIRTNHRKQKSKYAVAKDECPPKLTLPSLIKKKIFYNHSRFLMKYLILF